MRQVLIGLALLAAFSLAATPLLAYQEGPVANGGSITGTVKFAGAIPAPKKLPVTKDKEVCGADKLSEELLVNKDNKGLKFAVVSLMDVKAGKAWPKPTAKPAIDQKGCAFIPHVLLLDPNGTVDILNSDGILHNIHTYSLANPPINKAQPKTKKVLTEKFPKAEIIKVTCDAHKWMTAWLVTPDSPYYMVTDANGNFKLEDVPPGKYKVQVWHELLGKQTQEVTVGPKAEAKVSFELAPKK